MKIVDKFNNLKLGAKRIFVGLMILSLLSTATGIGSIFAYADGPTEGGDGSSTEISSETSNEGTEGSGEGGEASGGSSDEGGEDAATTLLGNTLEEGSSGGSSNTTEGSGESSGGSSGSSGSSSESAGGSSESSNDGASCGGEASSASSGASGQSDGATDASSGAISSDGSSEASSAASSADHEHKYVITPLGNGTHRKQCQECNLDEIENCKYDDEDDEDHCSICGEARPELVVSLSEVTFTLNDDGKSFNLKYNDSELAAGEDYTIKEYNIPSVFVGGQEYTIVYEGKGRFKGEVTKTISYDVTPTYDGTTELKQAYYYCVVIGATDDILIDTSADGAFSGKSIQHSTLGENQTLTVYYKSGNGIIVKKVLLGITVLNYAAVTVKYNGEELKDWYNDDVKITADGYLVSDNSDSGFSESYMMKRADADSAGQVSKILYFRNDTTPTAAGVPVSVKIDSIAPKGVVYANHSQYLSLTFESEDAVCGYENSRKSGTITGEDEQSGLAKTEFYISDTFYENENTLIAAMQSDNKVWTNGNSFTLIADQRNYVYARLTDNAGNETYLSTHAVVCDTIAPVITEISTTKVSDGAQISIRGTDLPSGIGRFLVIAEEKDGNESEPSVQEFIDEGTVIWASKEGDGTFAGNGTIGNISADEDYVFYCIAEDRAENYSQVKSRNGYSQDITIPIKYNGGDLKDWFNKSVVLTAEDYSISETGKGKFNTEYTMTGSGSVTKRLDFKHGLTGVIKTYNITVNIDEEAPTGIISCEGYSSKTFQGNDKVAFYTNGKKNVNIQSTDQISGIASIQYFVGEKYFSSSVDFANSMTDTKTSYRTYTNGSTISFEENKNNYIYVKITDNAGNETFLSTGKIVCDTKAPTLSSITLAASTSAPGTVVIVVGKDELSGISRFKLMVMDKDNAHEPSKDEIFNNGLYLEVSEESNGEYGAKYTFGDITEPGKYIFYAAAVDRADNVSDISKKAGDGSSASTSGGSSAAGGSSSSAGKSGGLTPAPSGIAGGGSAGSGAGGSGSGSSTGSGTGTESNASATDPLAVEINRLPYIADATGSTKIGLEATGGWDRIVSEIRKADLDATIDIEMSGLSEIPVEVFAAMAERPVTLKFRMPSDVTWIINGTGMKADSLTNMDLNVRIGSKSIPDSILSDVASTNPHFEFEISYTGPLGFIATLVFPVGANYAGMYANLYHYQEANKDMVLEKTTIVNGDGYAEFEMAHASSFSAVLTSMALVNDAPQVVVTTEQNLIDNETLVSTDASLRIPDLFGLKGRVRLYLIIIGIISAVMCIVILFLPGLQLPKKKEESIFDQFQNY